MTASIHSKLWTLLLLAASIPGSAIAKDKNKDQSQIPPIRISQGISIVPCGGGSGASTGQEPAFQTDVACLEARVLLEHASSEHKFRFLWYDADGNLYAATKKDWSFKPAEGKTGYHKTATLTHKISVKGEQASFLVGNWKAVAEMDDVHLAEARFKLNAIPVPLPSTLQEAKKLYLDLQYDKVLESLGSWLQTQQPPAVEAEGRWWLALSQNALGQQDEAKATLESLLKAEPTFSISPEDAQAAGGEELRVALEETRKSTHPDLYVKTGFPPQVELSAAEEAPVLSRRWPFWKKALVYGAAPVAVGAGVFFLAKGSDDSIDPISITASIVGAPSDSSQFQCVPVSTFGQVVNKSFNVEIEGGSGNYGIEWDFNRSRVATTVTPAVATDQRQISVGYQINDFPNLTGYIITVTVRDKDVPESPPARDAVSLIFNVPERCQQEKAR